MENSTEKENAKQIEVIQAVKAHNPQLTNAFYAVGSWIWAEFQQKLSQEEIEFLKQLGFKWNPVRRVWQNACGVNSRSSTGDPRLKYQILRLNEA